MNKEQHDKLIKYESIFKTAIESNYYRSMDSRFASDFISMCHELNVYIKPSCPACVLNALKTMGKLYFDYKEPVEENSIQDVKNTEDTETITQTNKVSQDKPKQQKRPIVTRSKTNKK